MGGSRRGCGSRICWRGFRWSGISNASAWAATLHLLTGGPRGGVAATGPGGLLRVARQASRVGAA